MRARRDLVEVLNRKRPEGLNRNNQPYRVLVVDDSSTMRRIIGQQLKAEAYEICGEAENGADGLQLYKELSPDVVTLDINMPVMDGLETLKRMLIYDKNAKIVMLTSEGQKQIVVECIAKGAKDYIVKPPNKAKVCEKVKKALEG